MDLCFQARDQALKSVKMADHMASVTLPMLKDPKLLIAILENINQSLVCSMTALLYYERHNRRIPRFEDTFESKFNMFRMKCVNQHNISPEYIALFQEIREIIAQHGRSPVEFVRGEHFVICGDDYSMKTVTQEDITQYIKRTKGFFSAVNTILED